MIVHTLYKLVMASAITQPSPLPRLPSRLLGKKIHMSSLDMSHITLSITPDYKYQYQLMLINLMEKHRSKINKGNLGQ